MADAGVTRKPSSRSSRLHRLTTRFSRRSSRQPSNFSPSDILPQDGHKPFPKRPQSDQDSDHHDLEFDAARSEQRSISPLSIFDDIKNNAPSNEQETEPTTLQEEEEHESYDLNPPPPRKAHTNVEELASRFFSTDHLDLILRDPHHCSRFMRFVETYKPQQKPILSHYLQTKKAIVAVEYANALANQIPVLANEAPYIAATLDDEFAASLRETGGALVEEALPIYLTHRVVSIATEALLKEITGNNTPALRELVPNVAEVYCLTDPLQKDNPIVYASEEFYNTTLYGSEYVIGRNCRFLQGPKTPTRVAKRLSEATAAGEEKCEIILNYRRDGSAFLNLLMIAPLYDNTGDVRYCLGCQIDVTLLIDGGKGLDSFAQLLAQDRSNGPAVNHGRPEPLDLLGELGQMLNEPETNFVRNRLRSDGLDSGRRTPTGTRVPNARRILSMDESTYTPFGAFGRLRPDSSSRGQSDRLSGVYRNYLLVRPYPSLRITFTSPALRTHGLVQSKFMDCLGGPEQVRNGVLESLTNSTSVTAKISWLSEGETKWIHCTPLLGSDEKVGVWMVVLVEEPGVPGVLNRQDSTHSQRSQMQPATKEVVRPSTGSVLYHDYLRGRDGDDSQRSTSSAREKREVDGQFRDFDT